MKLADKRYLITGAAGFVGAHLGNALTAEGATVQGLDSFMHASEQPLNFPNSWGDVRDPEVLVIRAKDADTIVHLAAVIHVDLSRMTPNLAYDINVRGTINVLETARRLDKDVVFASSSEVYGTAQRNMDESHPLDGQSPYAASKIAGDRACKAWKDTYGMNINIVRSFNTFGPWQASDGYGGVIAKFVRWALAGEPMQIYGDGTQRRDYLWIDDAVTAYKLALIHKFPGPVNFGTGQTVNIKGIAEEITRYLGLTKKPFWIHTAPRPGEVQTLQCDATLAAKLFGWAPTVSFQEGLHRYIIWAGLRQ